MKRYPGWLRDLRQQRGAVLVFVAGALVLILLFGALAIDVGYALVARNEVADAADAAALAGARYIGQHYEGLTLLEQKSYSISPATLIANAELSNLNSAIGKDITIRAEDVSIGKWDSTRKDSDGNPAPFYDIGGAFPNAVRVIARRDNINNGPVSTLLADLFGGDATNVNAEAIAALSAPSIAETAFPVGISNAWFKDGSCNQTIKFNPTGTLEGCAAWTGFDDKANTNDIRKLLEAMTDGSYVPKDVVANTTKFAFTNGVAATLLSSMQTLFDTMKVKNDGTFDADDDPNTWTTQVLVYDKEDCSPPNKLLDIVGFATTKITAVCPPSDKSPLCKDHKNEIIATVICELVDTGRSGGQPFGTMGSIPQLVK